MNAIEGGGAGGGRAISRDPKKEEGIPDEMFEILWKANGQYPQALTGISALLAQWLYKEPRKYNLEQVAQLQLSEAQFNKFAERMNAFHEASGIGRKHQQDGGDQMTPGHIPRSEIEFNAFRQHLNYIIRCSANYVGQATQEAVVPDAMPAVYASAFAEETLHKYPDLRGELKILFDLWTEGLETPETQQIAAERRDLYDRSKHDFADPAVKERIKASRIEFILAVCDYIAKHAEKRGLSVAFANAEEVRSKLRL
jgi:hypothetical protein